MITNNGLRLMTMSALATNIPNNNTTDINGVMYTTPLGNVLPCQYENYYKKSYIGFPNMHGDGNDIINDTDTTAYAWTQSSPLIFCGTGTTPPTREDIKLENCISDFKKQSTTLSCELGKLHINVVFKNLADHEITINELGLYRIFSQAHDSYQKSSIANNGILIARRVLDEPITVQANETFSINYTIDFTTMTD